MKDARRNKVLGVRVNTFQYTHTNSKDLKYTGWHSGYNLYPLSGFCGTNNGLIYHQFNMFWCTLNSMYSQITLLTWWFFTEIQKHSTVHWWGQIMGCPLRILSLIYTLHSPLPHYMWYHIMLVLSVGPLHYFSKWDKTLSKSSRNISTFIQIFASVLPSFWRIPYP